MARATIACAVALAMASMSGCNDSSDGAADSSSWTAEEVQTRLAESVAQNLSVAADRVSVACPEGLATAVEERTTMTCTAQVGEQRYPIDVRSSDSDDSLIQWRHTNAAVR